MILSIHLRKCAGTSFRAGLQKAFGARLYLDYGDEIGSSWPSSQAKRQQSQARLRGSAAEFQASYDIVHGHYLPSKYAPCGPDVDLITFLRDPVARVVSNYAYLKHHPKRRNPDAIIVNDLGFSLMEFARHPDNVNFQSKALEGLQVSDFTFIGLVEHYAASIASLNRLYGWSLPVGDRLNVGAAPVALTAAEITELQQLNDRDMDLYEAAARAFGSDDG
ncbi:MAG: hypothetical protein AAGI03_15490 [Pseudomonadota bacterium]